MELNREQQLRIKAIELAMQVFQTPNDKNILDFAEKIYQFLRRTNKNIVIARDLQQQCLKEAETL